MRDPPRLVVAWREILGEARRIVESTKKGGPRVEPLAPDLLVIEAERKIGGPPAKGPENDSGPRTPPTAQ